MADFGALFSDVNGVLDMLKPETLEKLGPLEITSSSWDRA
jgi:hypothetical protein